ncbi:TIGR03089 family protein [Jatrophihabitans telluris]|uniref:TIGR03089 family protein n=1 Tax=Jatrophihabitans telluris TaxID=2038343 RepID=A0ABY4QXA5_9ACTN|nr:TIGR03089 family protein [Jatrophihabitans telluris]UQX87564.1 TIGR03089 family protein [Jatrophihabitans telluris]
MALTAESAFDARLTADPSAPLLTFYDDETGERAELSARSLGNWVAKTHHLLGDELGLGVGDRAYVSLPVHWLAAPILLGCWFAGLEVVSSAGSASVAFGDAETLLGTDLSGVDEVFAVSLLSMARSAEPPPRMSDYAATVRPHADAWAGVRPQGAPDEAALDGLSRTELGRRATTRAGELGLSAGGRLLWQRAGRFTADGWVDALLAPLIVGGSVVLVRHGDPARLTDRVRTEKVTVTA